MSSSVVLTLATKSPPGYHVNSQKCCEIFEIPPKETQDTQHLLNTAPTGGCSVCQCQTCLATLLSVMAHLCQAVFPAGTLQQHKAISVERETKASNRIPHTAH